MKVYFQNKKLERLCSNPRAMVKELGILRAEKLQRRLDDLYAATSLEDTRYLPGHFHELTADRKGQWACDLDQPYRLIFEPTVKPIPVDDDGRYIWDEITIIDIVEIANYHGK